MICMILESSVHPGKLISMNIMRSKNLYFDFTERKRNSLHGSQMNIKGWRTSPMMNITLALVAMNLIQEMKLIIFKATAKNIHTSMIGC